MFKNLVCLDMSMKCDSVTLDMLNFNIFSVKKNNDYKEVSNVRNTGWFEKELLEKEGFELYKSTKYLYQVKDYKKHLFDFEKETNITVEQILEIDKIGLSYLYNVENCIRKDD